MKRFILSIIAAVAVATAAHAQTTPAPSFYRFQCDPHFDVSGNPKDAVVQAYWQTFSTDINGNEQSTVALGAQWDAIAQGSTTVSIPGPNGTTLTVTYAQLLQLVMAAANQERAAGHR